MTEELAMQAEAKTEPAAPVAALPYRFDEDACWALEVRLIIVAVMVSAVLLLASFGTSVFIHFQPGRFRTIGGFQSLRSFEFALSLVQTLFNVMVVVGGAAFFARLRVCRPLLVAGSIGTAVVMAVGFVHYTFFYGTVSRSGAEIVIWAVWRLGWFFQQTAIPLLTLAVMTRPYVKARFRPRTEE